MYIMLTIIYTSYPHYIYPHLQKDHKRIHKLSILSIGTRLHDAVLAAREVETRNPDTSVTVADARFMKPLDTELLDRLALENDAMITVEEGSRVSSVIT